MKQPQGSLTAAQYEILEVVWSREPKGVSVGEIWQEVSASRPVTRTTILNQVDRLVRRGWLVRRRSSGINRFRVALSQDSVDQRLAGEFLDGFFKSRSIHAISSLLGTGAFDREDLKDLRRLVNDALKDTEDETGGD